MSIFDRRVAFKPFEYPEIMEYKNAINHSYWLVSEWNFISDIHDFAVNLSDTERNAIKNALLAISQIEVSVKKFWTKLGDRFPKAEFEQVGVTNVNRPISEKLSEIVSVKDFGATGDGVTDDTEAINRALYQIYCVQVNPQIRRSLYFPAGVYLVSSTIIVPPFATLYGEGPESSAIVGVNTIGDYVIRS